MRASAFLFFFVNLFSVFALADVCPQDFIGTSAVISLEGRFVNREFSRVHTDIIWRHYPNEADTFDITLSGIYTGRMYVPHFGETDEMRHTPDFLALSAKAAYTFSLPHRLSLQLNCGVQNIFNAFQKDLDRGEYRDSGYFYGPAQPRTVFLGCKISY